jgi:L-alanine-DL-glutamate epimerase-like enolase superfamily enzyme
MNKDRARNDTLGPSPKPDLPVTSVAASACTIPTDAPEADGTLTWDSTTLVLVQVRAGENVGTGWTYAPPAAVAVVEQLLSPVVCGMDALAPAAAQQQMSRAVRNAGRSGLVAMAISAVDVALWDLAARLHGLPLTRLWGGPVTGVEVYGSGGFTSYDDDQLRRQLTDWTELGLTCVKIKIGASWGRDQRRDLARVAVTRDHVGDDVDVFVDANGGYNVGQACRVGKTLDEHGVTWFEEPVSSEDRAGLRRVRECVSADVTAGEYGHDIAYFTDMAQGAVDCVQIDATRCGGYTEWLRASAAVAGHNLDVSGHCAPYLTAPVAAVTPNLRHVEWFHDHVRIEQLLFEGAHDPIQGQLHSAHGDGHGHGLTLRTDVFDTYRVA